MSEAASALALLRRGQRRRRDAAQKINQRRRKTALDTLPAYVSFGSRPERFILDNHLRNHRDFADYLRRRIFPRACRG
jgi:hypothetical protein